jgi:hypothetical protein
MVAAAICGLLIAGAGCGEQAGVSDDAVVAVYVEAPLCAGAERELASEGRRAGSVRVRAVCLPSAREGARVSLAAVGANARRASEDSATVAYLEAPTTPSFSRPIVEAAAIPVLRNSSGSAAMARLLGAIRTADADSLRESIRESLN